MSAESVKQLPHHLASLRDPFLSEKSHHIRLCIPPLTDVYLFHRFRARKNNLVGREAYGRAVPQMQVVYPLALGAKELMIFDE